MDHTHHGNDNDQNHGNDHGNGNEHGNNQEGHGGMEMTFHWGVHETILFNSWTTHNLSQLAASAFVWFVLGFFHEGLKFLRELLYARVAQAELQESLAIAGREAGVQTNGACCSKSVPTITKPIYKKIFNKAHLLQTILHVVQVALSYLLMLIVMSYNGTLFLCVILGAAVGYLVFGWIKQQSVNFTEHCN